MELSASVETLDSSALEGSEPDDFIHYPKLTIGKGLYGDGDLFFNFIPFNQVTRFSRYGLQYRQSLWQSLRVPVNFSLLVHGNSANIDDKLVTRTFGGDLIASYLFKDISFSIGAGYVASTGTFSSAAVEPGVEVRETIESLHLSGAVLYKPDQFLFGLGVDWYQSFVFSIKTGIIL